LKGRDKEALLACLKSRDKEASDDHETQYLDEWEIKKRKEKFLIFTRVLMKYLGKRHSVLIVPETRELLFLQWSHLVRKFQESNFVCTILVISSLKLICLYN